MFKRRTGTEPSARPVDLRVEDPDPRWTPLVHPEILARTEWQTPAAWADEVAALMIMAFSGVVPGLRSGEADHETALERTKSVILDAYQWMVPTLTMFDLSFLVFVHPAVVPIPVEVRQFPSEGERIDTLRLLAGVGVTHVVEKPEPVVFETEQLGTGLRGLYGQTPKKRSGAILGALSYGFRLDEHGRDVRVLASHPDLGLLVASIDAIDELVRAVTVEPIG